MVTALAAVFGFLAGLMAFRLKVKFCRVCRGPLQCLDCVRRTRGWSYAPGQGAK
jgi:hypothetical protein